MFRNVLMCLGFECSIVPREAHWPNLAKERIDVLRTELKQILNLTTCRADYMSPRTLFQAAVKRSNSKLLKSYKVSRAAIHRGNRPQEEEPENKLESLFSLCPAVVTNRELESMVNCMDEKREQVVQTRARPRLLSALRIQVKQAPPQLSNGDKFLVENGGE